MEKVNINTISEICDFQQSKDLVIIDDIRRAYDAAAPKQMLIEGYMFGVILQGNARIVVDDREMTLGRGDVFGCNPRNILERSMLSIDLKVIGFFVTPEYTKKLLANISVDWSFLMMAKTHEVLHLEEDEMERLCDYTNLLRKKLAAEETPNKEKSIEMFLQSMGLEIFDIRQRLMENQKPTTFSHAENLVQKFMLMLAESSQHGKPYSNVNGYAERLNISPKYFSHICKNILGKTASGIINEDIMCTANMLLHDNSLSIKQISDRLGFANQSHFGTFFRRHSGGKSPLDVRAKRE